MPILVNAIKLRRLLLRQTENDLKKITPLDLVRAATAVVVFGIPLIAGAAAVLGYGAYKAFKKLKR